MFRNWIVILEVVFDLKLNMLVIMERDFVVLNVNVVEVVVENLNFYVRVKVLKFELVVCDVLVKESEFVIIFLKLELENVKLFMVENEVVVIKVC